MSLINIFKRVPNSKMDDIKYFLFSYSTGTMMNSSVRYTLKKDKKGNYSVEICPDGVSSDDTFISDADNVFAEKILLVLKKHQVGKWNGFNKIDRMVMDGDGFSLDVSFRNGKRIQAHGYMRYPKNYSAVRAELDAVFMNLYPPVNITE